MAIRFHVLLTIGITAVLATGCSLYPFGRGESRARGPDPLAAAPTGTVTDAPLPAPTAAEATQAPSGLASLDPSLQTASAPPPPPAPAGSIGRTDLLGGWTIASGTDSCQLFMTLTTWAGGYRASTRGCSNPPLQTISAWNMDGEQVQLFNDAGTTVARIYPVSKTQFSGQTEAGAPLTVSR